MSSIQFKWTICIDFSLNALELSGLYTPRDVDLKDLRDALQCNPAFFLSITIVMDNIWLLIIQGGLYPEDSPVGDISAPYPEVCFDGWISWVD